MFNPATLPKSLKNTAMEIRKKSSNNGLKKRGTDLQWRRLFSSGRITGSPSLSLEDDDLLNRRNGCSGDMNRVRRGEGKVLPELSRKQITMIWALFRKWLSFPLKLYLFSIEL
jgi:hypothetical protein